MVSRRAGLRVATSLQLDVGEGVNSAHLRARALSGYVATYRSASSNCSASDNCSQPGMSQGAGTVVPARLRDGGDGSGGSSSAVLLRRFEGGNAHFQILQLDRFDGRVEDGLGRTHPGTGRGVGVLHDLP